MPLHRSKFEIYVSILQRDKGKTSGLKSILWFNPLQHERGVKFMCVRVCVRVLERDPSPLYKTLECYSI